jgi:DNA-binding LytR/AlgR family response regulator
MNTNILIADDELAPLLGLRDALTQLWPQAQIVAQCEHGINAWDSFLEHEPQVCFLDIKMPGLNGFEVAKKIDAIAPNSIIVFCTAHGEFALDAFDAGAIDYLLKPIDLKRLEQTIARIQSRLNSTQSQSPNQNGLAAIIDRAIAKAVARPTRTHLQASVGKEIRLIDVQNILFLESDTRYTRIVYLIENPSLGVAPNYELGEALIRTPLKELLADLDEQAFWQVHRATIVNRKFISSAVRVSEGLMNLNLLYSNEILSVSRQFQGLFKAQ